MADAAFSEWPYRIERRLAGGAIVLAPTRVPVGNRVGDAQADRCLWSARDFARLIGADPVFVQDNHSHSHQGVLRGLHFQRRRPQGKLIQVLRGASHDVAVDLRVDSPDFGRGFGVELSETSGRMLWVPPGFAHGYLALSDEVDYLFKVTETWQQDLQQTLAWDDFRVRGLWPADLHQPLLSNRDQAGKGLAACARELAQDAPAAAIADSLNCTSRVPEAEKAKRQKYTENTQPVRACFDDPKSLGGMSERGIDGSDVQQEITRSSV